MNRYPFFVYIAMNPLPCRLDILMGRNKPHARGSQRRIGFVKQGGQRFEVVVWKQAAVCDRGIAR